MKNLQSNLNTVLDSKQVAEAARDSAMAAVEASKTAEGAAVQKAEELRAQIATQKEANLAAASIEKAREVAMKAEVEHMRESLNRKELEINAGECDLIRRWKNFYPPFSFSHIFCSSQSSY